MISDNKYKLLKYGILGVTHRNRQIITKIQAFICIQAVIAFSLFVLVCIMSPNHRNAMFHLILGILLSSLSIQIYVVYLEHKYKYANSNGVFSLYEAVENMDEAFLIKKLEQEGITIDKLDDEFKRMKGEK